MDCAAEGMMCCTVYQADEGLKVYPLFGNEEKQGNLFGNRFGHIKTVIINRDMQKQTTRRGHLSPVSIAIFKTAEGWGCSSAVQCLPSTFKALISIPCTNHTQAYSYLATWAPSPLWTVPQGLSSLKDSGHAGSPSLWHWLDSLSLTLVWVPAASHCMPPLCRLGHFRCGPRPWGPAALRSPAGACLHLPRGPPGVLWQGLLD